MKLKIKQLVAWIGGKDRQRLVDHEDTGDLVIHPSGFRLDAPIPVSIIGSLTQGRDNFDHFTYGKHDRKFAYPYNVEVTAFSQEPFPLRLLLDIMDTAQRLREVSYVSATTTRDGYYNLTEHEAAQLAVANTLGVGYPELSRFVYLASYWWNDIEELRNSMKKDANRKPVIEVVEADRPE